jgi:hypothetical protein
MLIHDGVLAAVTPFPQVQSISMMDMLLGNGAQVLRNLCQKNPGNNGNSINSGHFISKVCASLILLLPETFIFCS